MRGDQRIPSIVIRCLINQCPPQRRIGFANLAPCGIASKIRCPCCCIMSVIPLFDANGKLRFQRRKSYVNLSLGRDSARLPIRHPPPSITNQGFCPCHGIVVPLDCVGFSLNRIIQVQQRRTVHHRFFRPRFHSDSAPL